MKMEALLVSRSQQGKAEGFPVMPWWYGWYPPSDNSITLSPNAAAGKSTERDRERESERFIYPIAMLRNTAWFTSPIVRNSFCFYFTLALAN